MSRPQRFSDPAVQQAGGNFHAQVIALEAGGQAEAAAKLLCQFAAAIEAHLGGAPGRSLGRILAGPVVGDTEDGRFLWLLILDLLGRLPSVRASLLRELELAFYDPATAPQIVLAILLLAPPTDVAGGVAGVYDRLAGCNEFVRRHAAFQRLGYGWGGLHAAHPTLQARRHAERKVLIEWFGRTIPLPANVPVPGRLAVLAPRIAGKAHSPTRVLLSYLTALQRRGAEVALFLTHDIEATADETMLFHRLEWPAFPPGGLTDLAVTALDRETNRLAAVRKLTRAVAAWAPSAILSFGAGDSMVTGLLARQIPVVEMLLNAAVAPLPEATAYLGPVPTSLVEKELKRFGLTDRLARYHEHAAAIPVAVPGPRPALPELPDEAITIATVSNTLQTIIDDALADAMAARLADNPRLHWLVVGPTDPPALAGREFHGRLVRRKYELDLATFLQCAQVYLHPPLAKGGGFAAADALAAGVPVVALAASDPGVVIGADWAVADEAALWAMLDNLVADPAAAAARGAAMAEDLRRRRDPEAAVDHLQAVVAALTSWPPGTRPCAEQR